MKKNLITICVILVACISANAQIFKLGIKGGINYANQTGTDITVNSTNYKTEAISNFHIGLLAEVKLGDRFSIQPEVLYSTQGAKYDAIGVAQDFTNDIGYISIPVMAKIYLNNTFSLEFGPQASFLMSKKNEVSINSIKNQKDIDFGAGAGLGIRVTKSIFLQGRYMVGLSEISSDAKVKNSVLQVSAGLLF
jgi:hypothetical protein